MSGFLRQIPSFLDYLVRRGARHANDASAAHDHNWSAVGDKLPSGLELQWLGTSGFRIAYQGHQILIDPYLTRVPMRQVIRRRAALPSRDLADRYTSGRVNAILIGHTHFDHALDAPAIARRDDCRVYGSRSMANLMRLHGQAERAVEVEPYRVYEIGPFEVTFVPSVHSKLLLGLRVPSEFDITCEHFDELVPSAYGCGQVYGIHISVAGVTFYHQGSADLIDEAIRHRGVDYLLAGIAGRGFTRDYARRILERLEPRVVVPHHYDNFFRPLDQPMEFSVNVNFGGFVDEARAVSSAFTIQSLVPLQTIEGG
jgi:L-ascorbate metabolism protein UlaG (beta-lactamase superfamily)